MTDNIINNIFLDSNLWIYLYAKNPPEKSQQVAEIIKNNYSSLLVSTQVLGELFHVLTRKKFTSKTDAITIKSDIVNTLFCKIKAGRVFLISEPIVGSKLTK